MSNQTMLVYFCFAISFVTCIQVANYAKLSALNSHCNRYTTCQECESSIDCQNVEKTCYDFCENERHQQNQIVMQSGIVDKIDNMEEMDGSNKIEIYQDMKADKIVKQLKANPTMGIGPDSQDPPIESQIYSTPQQKCLDSIVCIKCAELMSCAITVDQECYSKCLK